MTCPDHSPPPDDHAPANNHHDNGNTCPTYDPHLALTPPSPSPTHPPTHMSRPASTGRRPCHVPLPHRVLLCHCRCPLRAAALCPLHPTAATLYVPPPSHSRCPCLPPFAAMCPIPVPPHVLGPPPHTHMPPCPHGIPTSHPHVWGGPMTCPKLLPPNLAPHDASWAPPWVLPCN